MSNMGKEIVHIADGEDSFCGLPGPVKEDLFETSCLVCADVINNDLQQVTRIELTAKASDILKQWIINNQTRVVSCFSVVGNSLVIVSRTASR